MSAPNLSFRETFLSIFPDADLLHNKQDGEVTILHGAPLVEELIDITFRHDGARIILNFKTRSLDFGVDFKGAFEPILKKVDHITLLHIDPKTKKAQGGLIVPLKQEP